MVRFFRYRYSDPTRRRNVSVLAFVLGCGFLFGSILSALPGNSDCMLITAAADYPASAGALLAVTLLPFLFTAFALFIRRRRLLLLISYLKASAFSYICGSVLRMYGQSGWLLVTLLLFSDCLALPLLCWVWIRSLDDGRRVALRVIPVVFFLVSGIAFLDCRLISPYLARLIS